MLLVFNCVFYLPILPILMLISIVQTTSYQSAEINQLLGIMGSQIKSEVNSKLKSPSSTEARAGSTVSSPDGVVVTAAARDDSNCLWRGLQIYDADLHTVEKCLLACLLFIGCVFYLCQHTCRFEEPLS